MVLPWIGYIGRSKSVFGNITDMGGTSSSNGFELNLRTASQDAGFTIPGFVRDSSPVDRLGKHPKLSFTIPPWQAWLFSSLVLLALYAPVSTLGFQKSAVIWLGLLLVVLCSVVAYFFFTLDFKEEGYQDFQEWHALEHKSVFLLESGLAPTEENLKKMPKTIVRCGSTVISDLLQVITTGWLMLAVLVSLISPNTLTKYVIVSIFASSLVSLLISKPVLPWWRKNIIKILSTPLMLPALPFSMFLQRFLFLKEPASEKYRIAVLVLKKRIDWQKDYNERMVSLFSSFSFPRL